MQYQKLQQKSSIEQLEIMGIKGRMLKFTKELISERWIKVKVGGSTSQNKQTDLGIPQVRMLSLTLFLVTINGILGEFEMEWLDHCLQMI